MSRGYRRRVCHSCQIGGQRLQRDTVQLERLSNSRRESHAATVQQVQLTPPMEDPELNNARRRLFEAKKYGYPK